VSAAENVGIPLPIVGTPSRVREERVAMMLAIVGLAEHAAHDEALIDLADEVIRLEDGHVAAGPPEPARP
jgi:ABC-type taurine transport system ATPase subunit